MAKTVEDKVYELFDDMDFDTLVKWADVLEVEHHESEWTKSEWTDLESELRQEVSNTMVGMLSREEDT